MNMDASEWITLVLARADELRRAGISDIACGDCRIQLRAPDPEPEPPPEEEEEEVTLPKFRRYEE